MKKGKKALVIGLAAGAAVLLIAGLAMAAPVWENSSVVGTELSAAAATGEEAGQARQRTWQQECEDCDGTCDQAEEQLRTRVQERVCDCEDCGEDCEALGVRAQNRMGRESADLQGQEAGSAAQTRVQAENREAQCEGAAKCTETGDRAQLRERAEARGSEERPGDCEGAPSRLGDGSVSQNGRGGR